MAALAQRDMEQRMVTVDRQKLLATLHENLAKHTQDYEAARAGYKAGLLHNLDEAFKSAHTQLDARCAALHKQISEFTDDDIAKQHDRFGLINAVTVDMPVPRSYAKHYQAAIDMMAWDVRNTLELTYAEFTCFVRDQWEWKTSFDTVSKLYLAK